MSFHSNLFIFNTETDCSNITFDKNSQIPNTGIDSDVIYQHYVHK
ncbi:hypothetical protein PULV_b0471 [Pseudoalteromonas ulvae UL12]|nr:hypothetical protein [Pseudoalteromonas ulvae UL12]